ncbi:MAG: homoserine kinase [Bacteroidetes bacterium]|nr:MAG: homoserine kinase [Bacteroidota bacterium]
MQSIKIQAPATSANVGPGYDIFALALHEPCDEFEISINESGTITIEIENNIQNIPTEANNNSAGLAAIELFAKKNITTGAKIKIIKRMTSGGGLGTTGASAAATIYGLNKLLNLKLSTNELIDFARKGEVASGGSPHADNVAAAILGGFVLVKSYNPIDVLKLNLPDIPVVLAAIKKSQRTTRGFITYEIGQEKLKEQMARCSRMIHAIHIDDMYEFGKALSVDYIHEPVRGAAIPEYWGVKQKALEIGAFGCTISGGGSSVIAFCPKDKQEEIAIMMEQRFASNPNFVKVIKTNTSNKGVSVI